MSIKDERDQFAAAHADSLAEQTGAAASSRRPASSGRSSRYVWYQDDQTLTLVVGAQEEAYCDTALAVGLNERGGRALRLVLPVGWFEPTSHRWAWLREDLPLSVWSHDTSTATQLDRPTREDTMALVEGPEDPVLFLGDRTEWVAPLMRWAGEHPNLDPSHRRDVRAWQCRGQRVLRIKRTRQGLDVVAGIDWGATSPHPTPDALAITGPLTTEQLSRLKGDVENGCGERMSAGDPADDMSAGIAHSANEHWLQAVLRRHPERLGLEQPVLREVAAWRPTGSLKSTQGKARGRGFVDLAGLDDTGVLTLVETKLDEDDMLVLQGLDYRIWAEANLARLAARLDCQPHIPIEICYAVASKGDGEPKWSRHAAAQFDALAPDIGWHVQHVTGWTDDDPSCRRGPARTFPLPPLP
jgi:hypothetical protein